MRILAVDLGDARIGLAISDILGITANPLETYKRKGDIRDAEYIAKIANDRQCQRIILGLPLNMDGTEGVRVEKTYAFAEELKKFTSVEIDFEDERLSTVEVESVLIEAGMRREKRKDVIDKLAATIILRRYMDRVLK